MFIPRPDRLDGADDVRWTDWPIGKADLPSSLIVPTGSLGSRLLQLVWKDPYPNGKTGADGQGASGYGFWDLSDVGHGAIGQVLFVGGGLEAGNKLYA